MTHEQRMAQAQCPAGGSHHWLYWYEGSVHMRQCVKCGQGPEVAPERNLDDIPVERRVRHARREAIKE